MSLKRRSFLRMIGASIAAPLMPAATLAAAPAAMPANGAALHAAIIHAQLRVSFSVWGLAKTLGVTVGEAETLMTHMAERGILGPLQGTTHGGRWATSNILRRETGAAAKAVHDRATRSTYETNRRFAEPDLSKLLAHLRQICVSNGMTLHPRSLA